MNSNPTQSTPVSIRPKCGHPGKFLINTFRRLKSLLSFVEDKWDKLTVEDRENKIIKMEFLIAKYQEYEKLWREKRMKFMIRRSIRNRKPSKKKSK